MTEKQQQHTYMWDFPRCLGGKEFTCQSEVTGLIPGLGNSLKEEMTTYSSILPGKLHGNKMMVMGSQRVRPNLETK